MTRTRILSAALAVAVGIAALPALAQQAPQQPPLAEEAGFKVDFGGGRTLSIQCGDATLAACLEAATPLIDKLAATPVVEGMKPMPHGGKAFMKGMHGMKGMKGRPGDRGDDKAEAEVAPPPPPVEGEAAD